MCRQEKGIICLNKKGAFATYKSGEAMIKNI